MTVYYTEVATSNKTGAGTNAYVYIKIHGDTGTTTEMRLNDPDKDDFVEGAWV